MQKILFGLFRQTEFLAHLSSTRYNRFMQKPVLSKAETAVITPNLYDYTYPQLAQLLSSWGYSSYHTDKLWQALYQSQAQSLSEMDLRDDLKQKLAAEVKIGVLGTETAVASNDGLTHKFLLNLHDGETIETVLMGFTGRDGVDHPEGFKEGIDDVDHQQEKRGG